MVLPKSLTQDGRAWEVGCSLPRDVPHRRAVGTDHYRAIGRQLSAKFMVDSKIAGQRKRALEDSADYDHRRLNTHAEVRIPVGWQVELGVQGTYARNEYRNKNRIVFMNDFLTMPVDETQVRKRRDPFEMAAFS